LQHETLSRLNSRLSRIVTAESIDGLEVIVSETRSWISLSESIEHRQIDVAAKTDRSATITGTDGKSVAGDFMHLKPVFSTIC
jgi:hypothetical protein